MSLIPYNSALGEAPLQSTDCTPTGTGSPTDIGQVNIAPPDDSVDTNHVVITGNGTVSSFGLGPPTPVTKVVEFAPSIPGGGSPQISLTTGPNLVLLGNASRNIVNHSYGRYSWDGVGVWTETYFVDLTQVPGSGGGGGGITDAPSDSTTYGRFNAAWVNVLRSTGGTLTGTLTMSGAPIAMGSQKITGLAAPTVATDAATKGYIDTTFAPLASPAFTGTPTAPTVTPGTDNTTKIATTAFVQSAISAVSSGVTNITAGAGLTGGGSGAVTLSVATAGITNAMHANMPTLTLKGNSTAGAAAPTDLTVSATMTMLGAAPLASPTFTGTPAAPTATAGTATTQLATTAFVGTALTNANVPAPSSATPLMNGTGAPGVAVSYSRGDHVHPSDTSRAPLVSPTFTGTPAAPTPATADNSTTLATTAYVKAQGYLTGNQTITLSGDITGSGTTAITTTLPTVNANVGTFQGITVNGKGQVTAAVSQVGTANPLMDGAVAVGTSLLYSRQDHVHPSDTSRAPTASPTFTGTATFSGATFNGTVTYTGTASEHHNVSSGTGAGIWFDSITTGADRFFLGTDAGVADNFRLYSILAGANVLAYQANATLANGSWVFSGNLTVTNNAAVQSTTASTSTTTGALVVTGGVGVGGSLNVGGPKITGPSFGASGASHAQGLVPDPGATAGTTRFLREDATWQTAGGGAAVYIQDTAPTTGMTAGSLWWNSTNGQLFVYYNDGTSSQWVFATPPAPQGILTVKETFFTASGTYTPSLGMVYCIAECVGGGGGGGGSSGGASLSNSGGGGGGGGYAKRVLTVAQIGASQSVTIGAAGANGTGGGSPTNGSAGGDTYLGLVGSPLLLAKGGAGGVTATAGSLYPGGVGGAASSGVGDIRIDGGEGGIGLLSSVAQVYVPSGFGGNSMWGPVTPGVCAGSASAVNGKVGKGYGAGGSGSEHIQTTGTASGGSGSAGAMLIMEFCTQ